MLKCFNLLTITRCCLTLHNSLEVARSLINSLEEKKAEDIVLLDLREISVLADYFLICSGTSERNIRTLSHIVVDTAKVKFGIQTKIEGQPNAGWIALDLGDIIVHIFSPNQRNFYQLEQLWQNSKLLLRLK